MNSNNNAPESSHMAESQTPITDIPLSSNLEQCILFIKESLGKSTDLIVREIWIGTQFKKKAAILYIDGLVDTTMIQDFIIRPLTTEHFKNGQQDVVAEEDVLTTIKEHVISIANINEVTTYQDIILSLLNGYTLILLENCNRGLKADTVGWESRSVQPPEDQAIVRGPRDSFTENLRTNTAMIRRKIKNPSLWLQSKTLGTVSQTNVAIMYLKGIADEQVVNEVNRRLAEIDIKGILESGIIEQLIEDKTLTPFPTIFNTERPDVVAAGLMEGRVAILVDGTPFVLLVPALFIQYLQAPEDYYQRSDFGLLRILRVLSLFIALLGPSLYIAITTFHQEMLPTPLIISIAAGREGVPFSAFVEALIMETTFEILREAGIRMPKAIGQAVSIVGALVIGQAAVEAGLISPGMVIVVSITAICSFVMPAYNLGIAVRVLRFPLMGLAAAVGLYGIFIGVGIILVHLCSLKSFGVPYMSPFAPFKLKDQKDSLLRLPKIGLDLRANSNRTKQKKDKVGEG